MDVSATGHVRAADDVLALIRRFSEPTHTAFVAPADYEQVRVAAPVGVRVVASAGVEPGQAFMVDHRVMDLPVGSEWWGVS